MIVENLSSSTSWQVCVLFSHLLVLAPESPKIYQDLKDFMRQAGEVTYTNCHQNRSGEGVAEFGSRGDMEYALDKLDGAELGGRRIKLCEEGMSRGRSRSRSR